MQISDANNKSSSPIKSEYLKVTFGDSIKFIPFVEIICCEANARYSTVFTLTDQFVSEKSLSELQGIFPPETFFRIHRKHIVNFSFVRELKRAGDRTYSVVLKFPFDKQLVVSREFRDQLQVL